MRNISTISATPGQLNSRAPFIGVLRRIQNRRDKSAHDPLPAPVTTTSLPVLLHYLRRRKLEARRDLGERGDYASLGAIPLIPV